MSNFDKNLLILNQEGHENGEPDFDQGVVAPQKKPKTKKPSLFNVILLNDDFTPMDFVVEVLMKFFGMNEEMATQVMLVVHTRGRAVCGIFTRDIAETKAALVNQYSSDCEHPLLCEIERAD
ncbi:MAG: ATP-dependent Clp protease adapter ClpS [Proteobacteria bacterium]|nr:MAG: ATP-dependent Clp protease adapter ClpS [Pseudomonadota bacterium]